MSTTLVVLLFLVTIRTSASSPQHLGFPRGRQGVTFPPGCLQRLQRDKCQAGSSQKKRIEEKIDALKTYVPADAHTSLRIFSFRRHDLGTASYRVDCTASGRIQRVYE